MAAAAFVGEEVATTKGACAGKTQCLHPDKPMMSPGDVRQVLWHVVVFLRLRQTRNC